MSGINNNNGYNKYLPHEELKSKRYQKKKKEEKPYTGPSFPMNSFDDKDNYQEFIKWIDDQKRISLANFRQEQKILAEFERLGQQDLLIESEQQRLNKERELQQIKKKNLQKKYGSPKKSINK